MPPTSTPPLPLLHAYRHLHRALRPATKSAPHAHLVLRARLRAAFRPRDPTSTPTSPYDAAQATRALLFLQSAAARDGLERRVLKNLVRTWGEREWAIRQMRYLKPGPRAVGSERMWEGFERAKRGLGVEFGRGRLEV